MLQESRAPWSGPARVRVRIVVLLATLAAIAVVVVVAVIVPSSGGGGGNSSSVPTLRSSATGLDVIPFPDTPDASARTRILFPALEPREIRSVTVTGSRSGRHAGRIEAVAGRRGTAFVPAAPFAPGERVSVSAHLNSPAAGTASGAPDATYLDFHFSIGATTANNTPNNSSGGSKKFPTLVLHTQPKLHPPAVKVTADPDKSSGDLLVDAANGIQNGVMVLNSAGQLVWFRPTKTAAANVNVQRYQGQPVLTWWQGRIFAGYGIKGTDVVVNKHYQTVATVHAGNGYPTDLHEFQLTPQDTALLTTYVPVKADLSPVGGPSHGTVIDSIVQEVDVKTGQVVWEWHALGHLPLTASEMGKPDGSYPYDFFHINSIQQLPGGNLLISARNTWGVYEVSRTTGQILWTLGGKHSSFTMGSGTNFEWQHDARIQPNGTMSLFDDADNPKEESQSRVLVLKLDTGLMQASLVHSYTHSPGVLANSQGSVEVLPNGNLFVGWGADPDFSEYTPSGTQIFNGSFTPPVTSYRARRSPWYGTPATPPAIAVVRGGSGGQTTVYASWNGASGVARWQLLVGTSSSNLRPVGTVASDGFETAIRTNASGRYFAVRALGFSGKVLGSSRVVSR